jgi:16S rRNA (cytosine967-C5)-methyltransferase
MVNAVLRKVAAAQKPATRVFESTAAFAERLGHPRWLVERWVAAYGREAALAVCEADQREHTETSIFRQAGGDLPMMDDGSRLVAELAAAAVPGAKRVWDCCAAPGGKTLMLALREPEAEIVATDVSAKRTAQMQARLRRFAYGERVQCAVGDATKPALNDPKFDLILCDVPCSGTGTLAGNPEIRHRLKPEDLARQAERQRAILKGALERLAPGGRLIYSSCSLEPEENQQVVDAVIGPAVHTGEFRRVPVEGLMNALSEAGTFGDGVDAASLVLDGALRTLPGVYGCDGFYAVVLERAA